MTREQQFKKYYSLLKCIASEYYKMLPPVHTKKDIISYGAIGLLNAIDRRDDSKGSFEEYVRLKIRYAIKDGVLRERWFPWYYRARAPIKVESINYDMHGTDNIDNEVELLLWKSKFKKIFQLLTEQHQQLILLYYYKNLNFKQIGSRLNRSESWAAINLKVALESFRDIYNILY